MRTLSRAIHVSGSQIIGPENRTMINCDHTTVMVESKMTNCELTCDLLEIVHVLHGKLLHLHKTMKI